LLSIAFIGGVFGASFYYPNLTNNFFLQLLILLGIIILTVFYKKPAMMAGFFIIFLALGIYWTNISLTEIKDHSEGKNFSGLVQVVKEPEMKGRYQDLTVKAENNEKFLALAGIFPEYNYGDVLKVDCKLEIPKNIDETFDYKMYLAKDGVYYLCNNPKIENTGENKGNKIYATLLKIKDKFNAKIMSIMPSPQSGLLSGLLIGGSGLLSKDYQNYFSLTGTTHIVAVSGYNVTIVAEYLMLLGLFIGFWRPQAFWFAAIGIVLFVVLTGMPSSAVRAGVMGILLIWAIKNGRLANAQNAILFAAVIMLLLNPMLLRWDVGFQLSFLATLGIVYVYPIFQNLIMKWTDARSVPTMLEILFLTLSAQTFVLPVLMVNFGKLSLISPLANVLVLPIIPLTMLIGFIAILFSFIIYPVGQVMAWLAFLPLKYETFVIKYLASLKYASVDISNFPWWLIVVWYIILGGGIILVRRKIKKEVL
jgi:competence protein ComEC